MNTINKNNFTAAFESNDVIILINILSDKNKTLTEEEIKEGYVDYIYYKIYVDDFKIISEADTGKILYKESISDKFLNDIIEDVLNKADYTGITNPFVLPFESKFFDMVVGINQDKIDLEDFTHYKIVFESMSYSMCEKLKQELFIHGYEDIEDFLGYGFDWEEEKDTTDNRLDEAISQMPDDILFEFYEKYVLE